MKKNKGFTLVELLAIIAILIAILWIAVPRILAVIENAKMEAFRDTAYLIVHTGELFESDNPGSHDFYYVSGSQYNADNYELQYNGGTEVQSGLISLRNSGNTVAALHNGTYCAKKNADSKYIEITTESVADCGAYDVIETCNSWSIIATQYDVPLDTLLAFNNETNPGSSTCGRNIKIPVEADSSNYDDFGIYYKTYYSMGYVADSASFPYAYQYVINLGNLPLPIANITSVAVSAESVFESLSDFKTYIVRRNLGDVSWPGAEPEEMDIDLANTFQAHAAQSNNMDVDNVVISCDAVKCQATIDVTVNNITDVTPLNNNVYTPLKFTVEFNGTPSTCFAFTPATHTITDYYYTTPGCPSKVKIPSTIGGVTVTTLGGSSFADNNLIGIKFPPTITTIGDSALYNNNIYSLIIPDTITSIANHAFGNNSLTGGVVWNNNNFSTVGSWSDPIFEGSEIGEITFGAIVSKIPDYLFFATDSPITTLSFPSNITTIGASAFAENVFTNVTFSPTLTTIQSGAFMANSLSSLTIPDTITSIGDHAFASNPLNSGVTWDNNNFSSVGSWSDPIFEYAQIGSISISEIVSKIPDYLFFATDSPITNYSIPNTITTIGQCAFAENLLQNVAIPTSVTSIQSNAFANNNLTSLTIPSNLTNIGDSAFYNNDIVSLTVPDSVTSIGNHAFGANPLNGGVTWNNDNFTSVGSWADPIFEYAQIGSITFGSNVTRIPSYLFFATDSPITSYTVPSTVNVIGVYAFGENLLQTVVIPASVTSIESQAFIYNPLTNLTINNGVTSIAYDAFGYTSLTSVLIPNSVSSIGTHAFANGILTSATIDNCSGCVTFGTAPFGAVTPTYLR